MHWPKIALPLLARLSHGWQLVCQQGSAAPEVIEHVLEGCPVGRGTLGLWLDRQFLRQPQWEALRALHLEVTEVLGTLAHKRASYGLETLVLDVGCGSARYAWGLLPRAKGMSVLCLRRNPRDVEVGRTLTAQRFGERLTFSIGDRCDPASYLTRREPDVVLCLAPTFWFSQPSDLDLLCSLVFRCLSVGGLFLFGSFAIRMPGSKHPAEHFSVEHLTAILESTGFRHIAARIHAPGALFLEARRGMQWPER